ncbi:MAG: hypothetical protein A2516_02520 [Alphaproteobacteria bacterium RIFOXYD12_FULL_60_8]|nr:MAG: hypothetical protein A2516_02520 [Alphaproteobacteria bacterium RIFOXYD12_FULL_60_8]
MSERKSVLLSTYINTVNGEVYALFGPVGNMTGFLCRRFDDVYMVSQPMPGEDDLTPTLTLYQAGRAVWTKHLPAILRIFYWVDPKKVSASRTVVRLKVRDFVANVYFTLFCLRGRLSLFIGVESINALSAVPFRLFNRVRTVLYFSNDYHPRRYARLMNWLFLKLDEVAARHADYIWMMNPRIHESRLERGLDPKTLAPHFIIHGGLPFFPGGPAESSERHKHRIVYATRAGHQGLRIVLEALATVAARYPDAELHVTGHADRDSGSVASLIEQLKIPRNVKFTGFLKEDDLNRLVRSSWIGLAVWASDHTSAAYGDPEKIRRYFHFGLPVVATDNAFTSDTIRRHGAGIVITDDPSALSSAILRLFDDEPGYSRCAQASAALGKAYKEHNPLDGSIDDLLKRKLL